MTYADTTAPIYAELIREQGDVPGDVRRVAEEVLRDLSRVIQMPPVGHGPNGGAPMPQAPMAPMAPMNGMHPMNPHPHPHPMNPMQ
ncbi:hypothetical protein [Streptomyces sp. NPDC048623]|uniref:hypothetical protein n=1 Tax=Streptomyces sp. NPDC048623 TaxID=3155761 RepID=UPI0034202DD8